MKHPYWLEEWLFAIGSVYATFRKGLWNLRIDVRSKINAAKYRTIEDAARSVLKKK